MFLTSPHVNGLLEKDNRKIPIVGGFNVKLKLTLHIDHRTGPSKRWSYFITNYMFKVIKIDKQ